VLISEGWQFQRELGKGQLYVGAALGGDLSKGTNDAQLWILNPADFRRRQRRWISGGEAENEIALGEAPPGWDEFVPR